METSKTKIRIVNMKTGHAVNSSSSHSLVIVKNPEEYSSSVDYDEDNFGWGDFVLSSYEEKRAYLSAMISSQYSSFDEMIKLTLKKMGLLDMTDLPESSVDHQSVESVPGISKRNGDYEINAKEFNEFLDAYFSPNVLVTGGNDNSDSTPADNMDGIKVSMSSLSSYRNGNTLCLFSSHSGTRITLAADEKIALESPMLLDLKITDYCAIKTCGAACYQNSTEDGKHCDMEYIYKMRDYIKSANVLEIALGGGETTHHPNFKEIVSILSEVTNVNFTTRNKEFLVDNYLKNLNPTFQNVGFALSIDSISDIDFLQQFRSISGLNNSRINAQYIVGQNNEAFLKKLIDKCARSNINLILLGWKTVGRGNTRNPFPIKDVYKHILKHAGRANISVDTAFLSLYGHDVIPKNIKITEEGVYSSYVDCIDKKLYKSSYHLDKFKDFSEPRKLDNFFDYSSFEVKRLNVLN